VFGSSSWFPLTANTLPLVRSTSVSSNQRSQPSASPMNTYAVTALSAAMRRMISCRGWASPCESPHATMRAVDGTMRSPSSAAATPIDPPTTAVWTSWPDRTAETIGTAKPAMSADPPLVPTMCFAPVRTAAPSRAQPRPSSTEPPAAT
jgi:hypothetical protein